MVVEPRPKEGADGMLQKASPPNTARCIQEGWKWVQVNTVAKPFKKCLITNHFYGTEDDQLWDTESSSSSGATDLKCYFYIAAKRGEGRPFKIFRI